MKMRCVAFLVVLAVAACNATTSVITKDLKLFVDYEEYFIKGICYEPSPLGLSDDTGLCSAKMTPWGDYKSACYDMDFFDGSSTSPGPSGGWFQSLWERDFPLLKNMGVNTLRLYNTNPTTRQASIRLFKEGKIAKPLGKDHTQFMDMAHKYGFMVIFPIFFDATYVRGTFDNPEKWAEFQEFVRQQIDEVGNHPALLMWMVGNEVLTKEDKDYDKMLGRLKDVIALVKSYSMQKNSGRKDWTRLVPITHAVVDIPTMYNEWMKEIPVDVFGTNAGYRGVDYSDLWTGAQTQGFDGFDSLCKQYNKTMMVTEFGWETDDQAAVLKQHPDWFNTKFRDTVMHEQNGCIGGFFFEYSDEPTKADPAQKTMGLVKFLDNDSTTKDVYNADKSQQNPIFDHAASGTYEKEAWSYQSRVFQDLLKRNPQELPRPAGSGSSGLSTMEIALIGGGAGLVVCLAGVFWRCKQKRTDEAFQPLV